jgi:predicted SnoaL-like aldol condensation-catalyzing enzyme
MSAQVNAAKETVIAATNKLFIDRDASAIDEYFGPRYVQHSALAGDGVEGLRTLVATIPESFRYEPRRAFAEGDLVVTHGIYHGLSDVPLVGFDMWRVANGKIVEHWDALTPVVAETASGRSQTDGPTEASAHEDTAKNRSILTDFAQKVLVDADYSVVAQFISTGDYAQHNPEVADGLAAFGATAHAWAEVGKLLAYKKIHHVIAEGDFVFLRSEGEFGVPVVYNDLFRLENGIIVEHWDIIAPVPSEVPHNNGLF